MARLLRPNEVPASVGTGRSSLVPPFSQSLGNQAFQRLVTQAPAVEPVWVVPADDPREREAARWTGRPPGRAAAAPSPPDGVERVLARPGAPMPAPLRADMERLLGHDFSGVRVHADADAGASARALGAAAYTVGNHVVFAPGRFAPGTPAGQRLMAHELAHVAQQVRAPVEPGTPRPLFRQPEKSEESEDPVAVRRRAARDAFAPLAETLPPTFGDDPQPLVSWATSAVFRLQKSADMTRAERIYTARGLVRAYAELKTMERRATRAADGALVYRVAGQEFPWSEARPRRVEEIPAFTSASVAQSRAVAGLDPEAGVAPQATAGPRGRGATPPAPAPAPAQRRGTPVKLAHTITFTKPAGLDITTDEGKLEVEARILRAMYPQVDDLLLSWMVTKLGTRLPTGGSRFTDDAMRRFEQTREGDPFSITADESLTFEADELMRTAPSRVSLISGEVYRSTYGMHYILAIEFGAALIAFTGGAAIGALAAEGASVAMTTTVMELESGGAVATDVAASQSFGALVRAGVGSYARGAILNAPATFAKGMAYTSAISAGVGGAAVIEDIRTEGFHAHHVGDIAGVLHSAMEGYVMMPSGSSGSTGAPKQPAAEPAEPVEPDIIVVAPPRRDPSSGMVRATIKDARTGAMFDGEIDPVAQTGRIVDRKTGRLVGVLRDGRFQRPDVLEGEEAPPRLALPSGPRGGGGGGTGRPRIRPANIGRRFEPATEEDFVYRRHIAGGPYYHKPPRGSLGSRGGGGGRPSVTKPTTSGPPEADLTGRLVTRGLSATEAAHLVTLVDAAGRSTPATASAVTALTAGQLRQLLPLDADGLGRVLSLNPAVLPTALSLTSSPNDALGGRALDALIRRMGRQWVEAQVNQPGAANRNLLGELGRDALATAARAVPTDYWAESHSQRQLEQVLDTPGSGFQRYRPPPTPAQPAPPPISEPGFRRGTPMNRGRLELNQRARAGATFPDIYGTEVGSGQQQAMEIKTPRVGQTVGSYFLEPETAQSILVQHGGRVMNLPAGAQSYLVVDIRQTGQSISQALADLSSVLRNYGRMGDARRLWLAVRFITGTRTAATLSSAYTIP